MIHSRDRIQSFSFVNPKVELARSWHSPAGQTVHQLRKFSIIITLAFINSIITRLLPTPTFIHNPPYGPCSSSSLCQHCVAWGSSPRLLKPATWNGLFMAFDIFTTLLRIVGLVHMHNCMHSAFLTLPGVYFKSHIDFDLKL